MRAFQRLSRILRITPDVSPSVESIEELRLSPVRSDMNGAIALVREDSVAYWYNSTATDEDNGTTRIAPSIGVGCWYLVEQVGLGGTGDILSTGRAGGQSLQGSSNSTGTLTLSSGNANAIDMDGDVAVNGDLSADVVTTGDLVMMCPERNARWRLIEYENNVLWVNETTGRAYSAVMMEVPRTADRRAPGLASLDPLVITTLNRLAKFARRFVRTKPRSLK
ncbi:hypothetical protein EBT31_16335 [bacterium]|nr:hypothetical protein [bacterium]